MKRIVFFLLIASTAIAVADLKDDHVVQVEKSDPQMDAAFAKARGSVDKFIVVLQSNTSDLCSVKVGVTEGKETEYFWIVDLAFADGAFTGTINNDPEMVHNVKFGQKITVKKNDIFDWLYTKGGKMYGNYTARVLLPKMSKEDADQLRAMLAPE